MKALQERLGPAPIVRPGAAVALVLALGVLPAAPARAAMAIPLKVRETAGVARSNECVVSGVPVARLWHVTRASGFHLEDAAGRPAPAQFDILARWAGHPADTNAAAKWVLVSFMDTVGARSTNLWYLKRGECPVASPAMIGIVTSVPGRITVNTGPASFVLNTAAFNLLDQVTVDGVSLLQPLAATNAIRYAEANGTNVVPGGAPDLTPRPLTWRVERPGPLHAVVRVAGSVLNSRREAVLDYTARWFFWAGRAEARLDFTVENNHPVRVDASEQPVNVHDQGSVNSVYLGSLTLALRLAGSAALDGRLEGVAVSAPVQTVRLYQDASGTDRWNAYVGRVGWPGREASAAPRLQSYCTQPGFTVTGAGTAVTGRQAAGWASVWRPGAAGPRLGVAVRDFWQNFPKAVEVWSNGTVAVDLFPNGSRFRHNLRVGEEKTHTLLWRFGLGSETAAQAEQRARGFNAPLAAQPPPSHTVRTRVLDGLPVYSLTAWPLYERYVRTALEPNPDFDPAVDDPSFGNGTLRAAVSNCNLYGWQDYGDVPLDYEAFGPHQAGQMNLKYWFVHGLLGQYLRSGDPAWLDLALPAARHLADVDFCHVPDEGSHHWGHGGYFGHSYHDEPGNLNPNRNYGALNPDLFFGVPDLLLAYHLTGEPRFAEVAREALTGLNNTFEFRDVVLGLERPAGNLIVNYVEAYRLTGDTNCLRKLDEVLARTTDLAFNSWVDSPTDFAARHPEIPTLKTFPFCQTLWAVGRYLDFLDEHGRPDTWQAARALCRYADFIMTFAMHEYQPGRAALPYEYYFDGDQRFDEGNYLDINDWALVAADALAYAYRYSGRTNSLAAARKFYDTGTHDPAWPGDPPVYTDTKQLVNALNWGLVYMKMARPAVPPYVDVRPGGDRRALLEWDALGPPYRYTLQFTGTATGTAWTAATPAPLSASVWTSDCSAVRLRFWRVKASPAAGD